MLRIVVVAAGFFIMVAVCLQAATFAPVRRINTRKLAVTREYKIPVTKGQKVTVALPAIMSFWGATNQQVVLSSDFSYSIPPDEIKVTADNFGMLRRNYELTYNSPQVDNIQITQKLILEMSCNATLQTAATLPYSAKLKDFFPQEMESNKTINLDNERIASIAREIATKTKFAEEAIELVCDWVNDNIEFKSGAPVEVDTVLSTGKGNCSGMANVAVAVLRKMGIPAEPVSGGGHVFMEAYFPDCGWVFYDLSNHARGFKPLNYPLTAGYCCRVQTLVGRKWIDGDFFEAKDVTNYADNDQPSQLKLRNGPKDTVVGAAVVRRPPLPTVKARHQSISQLIMNLSIEPGPRPYQKEVSPLMAQNQPSPLPTTRPAARPTATTRP